MEKVTKIVVDPKTPMLDPTMSKMEPKTELPNMKKSKMSMLLAIVFVAIGLGAGTGMVLAKKAPGASNSSVSVKTSNSVQSDTEAGINDDSAFPDSATGVLTAEGLRGEGTHHLDRSATNEKEVALSSTVINLDNFVGKKVEVKGQTISSKTSGWLMDVGKIKVIQ